MKKLFIILILSMILIAGCNNINYNKPVNETINQNETKIIDVNKSYNVLNNDSNLSGIKIKVSKEKIRELYYAEINKPKINFSQLVEEKSPHLSNKFLEWINNTKQWIDFSSPNIQAILSGDDPNGTFEIAVEFDSKISIKKFNETVGQFGEISVCSECCFYNLGICDGIVSIKDIFLVDKFINYPFVNNVFLDQIRSNYIPNPLISEYCEKDDDCVFTGGCFPSSVINKHFVSDTGPITCPAVLMPSVGIPVCINNKCSIKSLRIR